MTMKISHEVEQELMVMTKFFTEAGYVFVTAFFEEGALNNGVAVLTNSKTPAEILAFAAKSLGHVVETRSYPNTKNEA